MADSTIEVEQVDGGNELNHSVNPSWQTDALPNFGSNNQQTSLEKDIQNLMQPSKMDLRTTSFG